MNSEIILRPQNRTTLYLVLAVLLVASAGYVLHHLSKKHYARVIALKSLKGMQVLGQIPEDIQSDHISMEELQNMIEEGLYAKVNLRDLYEASNLSDEEVLRVLSKGN